MTCRLRLMNDGDLERVMRWRMLPEITQNMYSDPQLTPQVQQQWFKRISQSREDRYWIIELGDANAPVGVLNLSEIDYTHRRCAWAYYIAEATARGRGIAKTLECNVYDHVLDVMGLNKLWCEVLSFNERVIRLHELFGSKVEGVLRQHIYKNGEFHDVVRMAVLRGQWLKERASFQYTKISIE